MRRCRTSTPGRGAGTWFPAKSRYDDHVEGGVGLTVAASVELMITRRRSCPGSPFTKSGTPHSTWLTEDGVPEVPRRARLGQEDERDRPGLRPCDAGHALAGADALETRWLESLAALTPGERGRLVGGFRA